MAFLDNSGDIILDAVLTDTGRYRMARGEFKVETFCLADDEIDYSLYNKNHASGSSYYDLEILQTPVLEAFTNDTSSMKNKLFTLTRNDLLYLPVLKANEVMATTTKRHTASDAWVVAVNSETESKAGVDSTSAVAQGIMMGESLGTPNTVIRIDQGLDTSEIQPSFGIDPELFEESYQIQMDHRLGRLVNPTTYRRATPSFVDDDNIANYFLDYGTDRDFVKENKITQVIAKAPGQTIAGPRGSIISFYIAASLDLNTGTYYFTKLGGGKTDATKYNSKTCYYIDSTVSVLGVTTGYRIDIPVRYIRYISG